MTLNHNHNLNPPSEEITIKITIKSKMGRIPPGSQSGSRAGSFDHAEEALEDGAPLNLLGHFGTLQRFQLVQSRLVLRRPLRHEAREDLRDIVVQ